MRTEDMRSTLEEDGRRVQELWTTEFYIAIKEKEGESDDDEMYNHVR